MPKKRSTSKTQPSQTPAPPAITRIGTLARTYKTSGLGWDTSGAARSLAQVVERACADAEGQARGGALGDPLHRYGHLASVWPVGRDHSPDAVRDWIADEAFDVAEQGGAEGDFGAHQLIVGGRRDPGVLGHGLWSTQFILTLRYILDNISLAD
jgi:hypothetical protein